MDKPMRFGRRLSLPSTLQLKNELRAYHGRETARETLAARVGLAPTASLDEIRIHLETVEAEMIANLLP